MTPDQLEKFRAELIRRLPELVETAAKAARSEPDEDQKSTKSP
jgi:hypothetical protein